MAYHKGYWTTESLTQWRPHLTIDHQLALEQKRGSKPILSDDGKRRYDADIVHRARWKLVFGGWTFWRRPLIGSYKLTVRPERMTPDTCLYQMMRIICHEIERAGYPDVAARYRDHLKECEQQNNPGGAASGTVQDDQAYDLD